MKKTVKRIICAVTAALMMTAVSCKRSETPETSGIQGSPSSQSGAPAVTASAVADPSDDSLAASGDFTITAPEGVTVSKNGAVYTVTEPGEYTLKGALEEGRIVVDVKEGEVTLILSGASVTSSDGAPIGFVSAESATVRSEDGTYNTVTDKRTGDPALLSETDENDDAAIYADCDLKISGKGTLIVTSSYDNGIKSKDDLKIKNVTLKVTSVGSALKGNDSVRVESGSLMLISGQSDGVRTKNTDVSSKGNQRGTVEISGGAVDIYAAKDGISAAYDVIVSGECTLNVFTSSYAGQNDAASSDLYLVVPRTSYSTDKDYYAYFYNEETGVFRKFEYETMVYSGRSASYYGLVTKAPSGYGSIAFLTVGKDKDPSAVFTDSVSGQTVNTQMNAYLYSSESSGVIDGDWVSLSSGGGNSQKTAYSSKGIKAGNEIVISSGNVTVYSKDDALHANSEKLENGASGKGAVTVNGGTVTLTAADDGIHADGKLTVNAGTVNVVNAHEGLEGNVIEINGGSAFVYGDDDGINACKGASTPLVNITGGYLEVKTPSGDTDGIDSNGSITMSGGFVLVKGGAANGGMAGSVDLDGTITVTGGTIFAFGGICETPGTGSVNVYGSNSTFSAGDYVLKDKNGNELVSFALDGQYSSCWIGSEHLALNGSYTLECNGKTVLSWTQSSQSEGVSGRGGFGGGGFGGGGRPGKR